MRIRTIHAAVVILAIALLSTSAGAFGESGHRIIGTLAEMRLRDTAALKEIHKILRPGESLADAAVWPDRIKDALYEDGDTAWFRLNHPGHDTYHYANVAFQADRYALTAPGARPTDIIQTTRECLRVLNTGSGPFTKREALRLLAHFVGDMHQPLHVGNPFVSPQKPFTFVVPQGPSGWQATLGGNLLVYGPELRFNLHSYWDTHAVNFTMGQDDVAAFAAKLLKEVTPAASWKGTGAPDTWPEQWATEGLSVAKEIHRGVSILEHVGPDELHKNMPHRWTIEQPPGYDDRARPIVRQQLAVAGFRLAELLKTVWP